MLYYDQPELKLSVLTRWTWNHVSTDGYYSSLLPKIFKHYKQRKWSSLVVIGHPKSMTNYSFRKLKQFIEDQGKKYVFRSFNDLP